jgi:hypothetical protein
MKENRAPRQTGRWLPWGLLLLALAPVACRSGASSLPPTYKVTGSVTFEDGKPVTGGAVQFAPVNDTTFSASGDINSEGNFTLSTVQGNEKRSGVPEGEYRVTVLLPIGSDQRAVPPVVLAQTYRVEAKDNHFAIEIPPPGKKP